MHRPARALTSLGLAWLLLACQVPGGSPVGKPGPKGPGVGAKGGVVGPPVASLIGLDGASLIGLDAASLIGADGATLVGPDGASLIGPDGASLIGMDGASITGSVKAPAGLVAAGAGNLVAAGAGNMVAAGAGNLVPARGGGGYRLSAAAPQPLAGVHVYLRTASGKIVVDPARKPISAVTNAQGEFSFKGWRAARCLTVFVPMARVDGELQGLAALRPKDLAEAVPVAVDAASTLMTSWIYERVLANQARRADSLDRLPAALGAATLAQVAASLKDQALPPLGTKAFADALERLRTQDAALGAQLAEVRRVMTLAGTDNTLTAGARTITLQQPVDVAQGPDGSLFVVESFGGIVRRIDQSGQATIVIGQGSQNDDQIGALFPSDLAIGPDGKLYVNSKYTAAVFRCDPDGSNFERFAGGGEAPVGQGGRALDAKIEPVRALAFDDEGGLLIGENDSMDGESESRLLRVAPDGTIALLPPPWGDTPALGKFRREIAGLAVAPDGAIWCLEFQDQLLWLKERGGAWRIVQRGVKAGQIADLLPRGDGSVLVTLGRRFGEGEQRIERITRDGARETIAGTGELGTDAGEVPALAAKLADPTGLAAGSDGSVLVVDLLAGVVRAIGVDGVMRLVVGRITGDDVSALTEPLNVPGGIAIDGAGQVVVTEYAGNSLRRIEGDRSIRIAGGQPGITKTGERATKLFGPTGVAFRGEDMIVVEQGSRRVVSIRPDGTLTVLAGGGRTYVDTLEQAFAPPPPLDIHLREPLAVAVSPTGDVVFTDREQLWRITADGARLELVGGGIPLEGQGTPVRDGKPAREVSFGRLAGLTYDASGNLYASEVNTSQIIKIDPAGLLTVFAGAGTEVTFAKLLGGAIASEGEVAAKEAAFVVPSGLAFDAQGNLYVSEMGTRGVQAIASSLFGSINALPLVDGRIRKITPAGLVTTVAGLGGPAGTALRNPIGLVVDRDGRVIFVDNGTNQLKRL